MEPVLAHDIGIDLDDLAADQDGLAPELVLGREESMMASYKREPTAIRFDLGADAEGNRLVRIHAVGFPVLFRQGGLNPNVVRFAALMRELAYRNDGTFVGLSEFQ